MLTILVLSVDLMVLRGLPVGPPVPADPVDPHQNPLAAVLPAAEVELRAGVELLQSEHQHSHQN